MLVDLYFPELKDYYQEIERGRDHQGAFIAQSITVYNAPESERLAVCDKLTRAHDDADKRCEAFLTKASAQVDRLI